MENISAFLSSDHRHCDDLFFASESAVIKQDWHQAALALQEFCQALEHHLSMEEEILFPEMEASVGKDFGPTKVMRDEHSCMRQIVQNMKVALEQRNQSEFLGNVETLNIMMQQHNLKEESMLYLMADRVLAKMSDGIIAAMGDLQVLT